jgi:hypothetical protein
MAMAMSCGIDWSGDHHDVAVVDADGRLVAKRRIGDDAAGLGHLLELLAEAGDSPDEPMPVAIETARGLLVAGLRAAGRPVYAINLLAVARYQERHAVSGKRFEDVGTAADAGAVSMLYGSAGGLTTIGGQLFTKDSPGIVGSPAEQDRFGNALATGDTGP